MNHLNKKLTVSGYLRKLIWFGLFLSCQWNLFSQPFINKNIASYPGATLLTGGRIQLAPVTMEEATNVIDIPLFTGTDADYLYEFDGDPGCAMKTDISIGSDDGVIATVVDESCTVGDMDYIEFTVKVTNNETEEEDMQDYQLPVVRKAVNLVYVLDISGSMGTIVSGSSPSMTRWKALQESVLQFNTKLDLLKVTTDKIALTYFTTDIIPTGSPMNGGFLYNNPVDQATVFINTDMGSRNPLNLTAIGKGLNDAKTKLATITDNQSRLIFLFTDGRQNVHPFVNDDGMGLDDGTSLNNYTDGMDCTDDRIYTIGIELGTTQEELLANISNENGGIPLTTTIADPNDFFDFFDSQFANILKDCSPQIVIKERGIISGGRSIVKFPLNGALDMALFQLVYNEGDSLKMSLLKDGKDYTQFAEPRIDKRFSILALNFPLKTDTLSGSAGNWEIEISGKEGAKYSFTCFADDHYLDYTCSFLRNNYKVGDVLDMKVSLSFDEKPLISPTNKVRAIILKPGEEIGQLTSTSRYRPDSVGVDIANAADQQFLDLLHTDTTFYNALLATEHIVELTNPGDGTFTGQFKKTEISGSYNITFLMEGEIPVFGTYRRIETQSCVIRYAELDDSETDITQTTNPDNGTATVTVRPVNRFGKFMGPGHEKWIKLSLNSTKADVEKVKDNLDGSYTYHIVGLAPHENPVIKIIVRDELLRQRPLSKIHIPSARIISWRSILLILLIILLLIVRLIKPGSFNKIQYYILLIILTGWAIILILEWLGIYRL